MSPAPWCAPAARTRSGRRRWRTTGRARSAAARRSASTWSRSCRACRRPPTPRWPAISAASACRPVHHRQPALAGRDQLGVGLGRIAVDTTTASASGRQVRRVVPDVDPRAQRAAGPARRGESLASRAGDRDAAGEQDAGDPAHPGAADPDQVDALRPASAVAGVTAAHGASDGVQHQPARGARRRRRARTAPRPPCPSPQAVPGR